MKLFTPSAFILLLFVGLNYRTPLITHFGISTQVFFSDTRHQKRSLAELNEYFDNDVAGEKTMLKTKTELLEVSYSLSAQNVVFNDPNFKAALVAHVPKIDTDGNGEIQVSEANKYAGRMKIGSKNITDLTGIEEFTSLTNLRCQDNKLLKLDLSKNLKLRQLNCQFNRGLTKLIVNKNTLLNYIACGVTSLKSLDVRNNTNLTQLICFNTHVKELDLSKNLLLTHLSIEINRFMTKIDLKNGKNKALLQFRAKGIRNLTCLKVDNVAEFKKKWKDFLDNTDVLSTTCVFPVTKITVNGEDNISTKGGEERYRPTIEPRNATNKEVTWSVDKPTIASINPTSGLLKALQNGNVTVIATAKDGTNVKGKKIIKITNQSPAPIVDILDPNFKAALVAHVPKIDINSDGEIQVSEAKAFRGMMRVNHKKIADLTGIEAFTSLSNLQCQRNNLKKLDLSKNLKLKQVNCQFNRGLTKLIVNKNTLLNYIACGVTSLKSLDVSNNTNLTQLICFNTHVKELDLSKNLLLTHLSIEINHFMTKIDLKNGKNKALLQFRAKGIRNLTCLKVDNVAEFKKKWKDFLDNTDVLSTTCVFPVTKITVNGEDNISTKGGEERYRPTIEPRNATNKEVTWSVDKPTIASINPTSGLLKALKNGVVTVKATAKDGSGKFGTKKVTITKQEISVKKITITGPDKVSVGGTIQLKVTVEPADATNKAVEWKVNDDKLATISTSDELKALKAGTVTVTATAKDGSGADDTKEVIITDKVTSVGDSELARGFTIYPNPANNHLTIDTEFTIKEIEITDLAGKRIKSLEVNKSIDISTLPPNIYLLRVRTDSEVFVRKFVKE